MPTNAEILNRLLRYSSKQVDIIYSDPDELIHYPTKKEMKTLIELCNKYKDFDAISIINAKYDIADFLADEDDVPKATEEQIAQAKNDFISFMKNIDSSFNYEGK